MLSIASTRLRCRGSSEMARDAVRSIVPTIGLSIAAVLLVWLPAAAAQHQDGPQYVPAGSVSGLIRVSGSPQMRDLLRLEEAAFERVQPSVRFENNLAGTLTAVASVATGRAEIGLLGREIWPAEEAAFESATGLPPTVIEVATGSYDVPKATYALMIFVNRANPLRSLSFDQLARIFASSALPPRRWDLAGLAGPWAAKPIHLYGFARDNDKARIFRVLVFSKGQEWAPGLREFRNSIGPPSVDAGAQIVQAVAADPNGIGISNIHYAVPGVRALSIAPRSGAAPVAPSRATIADRSYPLARAVSIVFDGEVQTAATPAVREFLRFILSRQGQAAVAKEGNYLPLTPLLTREQRAHLKADSPP